MEQRLEEAAEEVHRELGADWSESIYHKSLMRELSQRGIPFNTEGTISVMYKGAPVGRRRPDLFLTTDDGLVIVELKAGTSSGLQQLLQYLTMAQKSHDLGTIDGGALVSFNDELEFEYIDLEEDG
jgi:GxxExxY protein